MIEITYLFNGHSAKALHSPGGFVWWYADLVNKKGDGCVIVWSFGLPFLPGSRVVKAGRNRPAIHFASYREGRPHLYLLTEYADSDARLNLETGEGVMGRSRFLVNSSEQEVRLEVLLDEPIPHSSERLEAKLALKGAPLLLDNECRNGSHLWAPRTACAQGRLELSQGTEESSVVGSGYFDSNSSLLPIHEQGIVSWRWGRVSFADTTWVFYEIQDVAGNLESIVFCQTSQGSERKNYQLTFQEATRTRYGICSPRRLRLATDEGLVDISFTYLVDDGPFYQRFLLTAKDAQGKVGHGMGEVVMPERVDLPWQRPFVRMRNHLVRGNNSMWLPLFTGPEKGRGRRLARSLLSWGRNND